MKYNMKDFTFTIPVRYDTDHRIENLNFIVEYINYFFDTNILVLEEGINQKFQNIKNCRYIFKHNKNKNMHRTKLLNEMSKLCETPFIANYDADVILKKDNYIIAVDLLRNNECDMVYPYDGNFWNISRSYINEIRKRNYEINFLDNVQKQSLGTHSVGGAIFWNKEKFEYIGMENENFKSWGYEDHERKNRVETLGLNVKRIDGHLFHIDHARLTDSTGNNPFIKSNESEWERVKKLSKEQLLNEIKTWKWIKD